MVNCDEFDMIEDKKKKGGGKSPLGWLSLRCTSRDDHFLVIVVGRDFVLDVVTEHFAKLFKVRHQPRHRFRIDRNRMRAVVVVLRERQLGSCKQLAQAIVLTDLEVIAVFDDLTAELSPNCRQFFAVQISLLTRERAQLIVRNTV